MAIRSKTAIWFVCATVVAWTIYPEPVFSKDKNIAQKSHNLPLITPKTSNIQTVTHKKNEFGAVFDSYYYDISYVYYDQDFADEFGLDQKNVVDMDDGLRLIEAKVVTEGKNTYCYHNFVLDKSVKIDFPPENYILRHTESDMDSTGHIIAKPRLDAAGMDTFKNVFSQISNKRMPIDLRYNAKTYIFSKTYEGKKYLNSSLTVLSYVVSSPASYKILITEIPCYRNFFQGNVGDVELGLQRSGYDKIKDPIETYYYKLNFPAEMIDSLKNIPKIKSQNRNPLIS